MIRKTSIYRGILLLLIALVLFIFARIPVFASDDTVSANDSSITICIDAGHYVSAAGTLYFEDGTSYCEGETTLKIARKLREILKNQYGIESILTRDGDSVTIDGYTDAELDNGHIFLRGEMAESCDFFISLHTNANEDNANGYETCFQPLSINKPIVIVNSVARENETALSIANGIGTRLAAVNADFGLTTISEFTVQTEQDSLPEWSSGFNDSLDTPGTVCIRTGSSGDYYGVLRGSASVNVPGMIVEHAFHTVEEVREAISDEDIITAWAQADADAIAEGFGIRALSDDASDAS